MLSRQLVSITCFAWLLSTTLVCGDDAQHQILQLTAQSAEALNNGRVDEARQLVNRMDRIARRSFPNEPQIHVVVLVQKLAVESALGQFQSAEQAGQEALRLTAGRSDFRQYEMLVRSKLGDLYYDSGRFKDSETQYVRAYKLAYDLKLPEHPSLTIGALKLSKVYHARLRYEEAERWARSALKMLARYVNPTDVDFQSGLSRLVTALDGQSRFAESELLYRQIVEVIERELGPDHFRLAPALQNLGMFSLLQQRTAEARTHLLRALSIYERHTPDSLQTADILLVLAGIAVQINGDLPQAESYLNRAREIADRSDVQHRQFTAIADTIEADLCLRTVMHAARRSSFDVAGLEASVRRFQEILNTEVERYGRNSPLILPHLLVHIEFLLVARENEASAPASGEASARAPLRALLTWAREIVDQNENDPVVQQLLPEFYTAEGRNAWSQGNQDLALRYLQQAMDAAERHHGLVAGLEVDQARKLETMRQPFEVCVSLLAEHAGNADRETALDAAERASIQTLAVETQLRGVDLLRSVPAGQRKELRDRLELAHMDLARLRQESFQQATSVEESGPDLLAMRRKLASAREDYLNTQRDIRNASRDYRLAVTTSHKPVDMEAARQLLQQKKAICLRYMETDRGLCLLAFDGGEFSSLQQINLTEQQRTSLGVEHGPSHQQIAQVLLGRGTDSLLALLRRPTVNEALLDELAVLRTVLIPDGVRQRLVSGDYDLAVVIPDGPLSQLPFEALVVDVGETPTYLLDVAPPVVYAPAVTYWANLVERPTIDVSSPVAPVMTVGNPTYQSPSTGTVSVVAGARTSFEALAGRLTSLPFSGHESDWVRQAFESRGARVYQLKGEIATERNIRAKVVGRHIVHFACHGLVDRSFSNQFGALAVSAGGSRTGLDNDGFLRLAELSALDLRSCDLAVLSACDTNLGPQPRGTAGFALTRSLLVAGARNVVTTNWQVDDEAAARLVNYFCAGVAIDRENRTPARYAERLRAARVWMKDQPRWSSPCYWAAFVLVGAG